MKFLKNTFIALTICVAGIATTSCEQESFDPLLTTEPTAGTLTNFKAYTLDSLSGIADSTYGRVVFWEALDGTTLVQLSLYNVPDTAVFPSSIMSGAMMDSLETELMPLYDITNTGEGYTFGEFSTNKYYVISDASFFSSLDTYDAHVVVRRSGTDDTIITAGDVGMNAMPVEEN